MACRWARAAASSSGTPSRSTPSTTSRSDKPAVPASADREALARGATDLYVAIDGTPVAIQGGRGATRLRVAAGPRTIAAASLVRSHAGTADGVYDVDSRTPGITQVTIAGPFNPTGPGDTPSRRRLLVCTPATPADEPACAAKILNTLATRAYRRAVPADGPEMRTLLEAYAAGRSGASFEAGIRRAVARVLVDPQFLFRFEREPANVAPGKAFPLSDVELASRLSFFLWSSIPDDELLDLARRGALRTGDTLERQVRRMLADPRADELVENFAGQWLLLRELRNLRPDSPDFDGSLRRSMQRETELLFRAVMREDRSVIDLLDADFTFVDERLARHYGVPDIRGSRTRRVSLPRRQPAPRPAGSQQRPHDHLGRQPHVAGRARQVGAREPAGGPAAAAASRCRDQPGEGRQPGEGHLAAPASRAASRERGVRVLPQADGSDRADARELRSHRQVADGRRPGGDRRLGTADRRNGTQRAGVAAAGAPGARGCVRHGVRREAADLRVGPRHASGRHAGRACDRACHRERPLPLFGARSGRRGGPPVPDAIEVVRSHSDVHHQKARVAARVPAGVGHDPGLAAPRIDGPGADTSPPDGRPAARAAGLHVRAARRHDGQVDARDRRHRASRSRRS